MYTYVLLHRYAHDPVIPLDPGFGAKESNDYYLTIVEYFTTSGDMSIIVGCIPYMIIAMHSPRET